MAEFAEVMRQWGRLCTQHCAKNTDDCDGCLLGGTRADVCGSYAKDNAEDVEELERLVMEWAAEHPEPVYPTWEEWLQSVGVMESSEGLLRRIQGQLLIDGIPAHAIPTTKVLEPIPADIAERLGVKPKEG